MAYKINRYVHEQNHYRFHTPERHYIQELEARGGLIRLDNVAVDAEQLVQRAFVCATHWCLRTVEEDGTRHYKGSCCTDLEVNVTPEETERLRQLGRIALEKLTFTPRDPLGEIARRLAEGRFTELTDCGETAFGHLRNGRCPLGIITRQGTLKCAINCLCQSLELPLTEYKPDPCFLFPLHYVEYAPGQFFVTVVCEQSHRAVGADTFVARLRCLRKPQPGAPPAFIALKYELIHCFGADFYRALAAAALPILERDGLAAHAGALAEDLATRPGKAPAR